MKFSARVLFFILFLSAFFSAFGCKNQNDVGGATGFYDMQIEYENEKITGSLTYTFYKNAKELGENRVCFNLYASAAFKKDAGTSVNCVKLNDANAEFELSGDNDEFLCAFTPSGIKADDKIYIEFETILSHTDKRLGITEKCVNAAYFYPVKCVYSGGEYCMRPYSAFGDPFFTDFANYSVSLTLPSVMTVACGFYPSGMQNEKDKTKYNYSAECVKNFTFSFSENYEIITKKWGNKSINYYYYDEETPEKTLDLVIKALDYFQNKIGEYRYNTLAFAKSPYSSGGMEYSAFFVLGESNDEKAYSYAAVHETAHQWFPMVAGTDEYYAAYFDEGLAEFLTARFFIETDSVYGKELEKSNKILYENYKKNYAALNKPFKQKIKNPLDSYSSLYEYVSCSYYGGATLFLKIFEAADEKEFFNSLNKFYNSCAMKNSDEYCFINSFGAFNKKTVQKIFSEMVF